MLCFCVQDDELHKSVGAHMHPAGGSLKGVLLSLSRKGKMTLSWMVREEVAFVLWLVDFNRRKWKIGVFLKEGTEDKRK